MMRKVYVVWYLLPYNRPCVVGVTQFRRTAENLEIGCEAGCEDFGEMATITEAEVLDATGPDEKDARIAALEQCIGNISDRIKNCRVAVDTNHDLDVVAMFDVIFEMTRDCCASIVYEERKKVHEQARAVQSEASSVVLHEE
jgi:hypothetical protein